MNGKNHKPSMGANQGLVLWARMLYLNTMDNPKINIIIISTYTILIGVYMFDVLRSG